MEKKRKGRPIAISKKHPVATFVSDYCYKQILQLIEEKKFISIYEFISKAVEEKIAKKEV